MDARSQDTDKLKGAKAKQLHGAVRKEGDAELGRSAGALFWSGLAGGVAVNASLMTEGALRMRLPDEPWRELVVVLGYPVGFLLVIPGRMQFFTESTITAVLPLVTHPTRGAVARTLRLSAIVLGANLIGTAVAAAAIASESLGAPEHHESMLAISAGILDLLPSHTFVNAIVGSDEAFLLMWDGRVSP